MRTSLRAFFRFLRDEILAKSPPGAWTTVDPAGVDATVITADPITAHIDAFVHGGGAAPDGLDTTLIEMLFEGDRVTLFLQRVQGFDTIRAFFLHLAQNVFDLDEAIVRFHVETGYALSRTQVRVIRALFGDVPVGLYVTGGVGYGEGDASGRWDPGGGRWDPGGGRWEPGGGRWEPGGGRWEPGGGRWEPGGGRWEPGGGRWYAGPR